MIRHRESSRHPRVMSKVSPSEIKRGHYTRFVFLIIALSLIGFGCSAPPHTASQTGGPINKMVGRGVTKRTAEMKPRLKVEVKEEAESKVNHDIREVAQPRDQKSGRPPEEVSINCSQKIERPPLDSRRLRAELKALKFRPPRKFRALVIEVEIDQGCVIRERAFDWGGESRSPYGWLVGSSIKPFAAIAALERLEQLGFDNDADLTFYHVRSGEPVRCLKREETCSALELVHLALKRSDNIAYNRLVQLAGYDYLNGSVLNAQRGIRYTGLHAPYARRSWRRLGGAKTFRVSPHISIKSLTSEHQIEARDYPVGRRGQYHCPGGGTCATLADLAEVTRRVFLAEHLPRSERYRLNARHLTSVREALRVTGRYAQSLEFVRGLKKHLPKGTQLFHKYGYARRWFTDVVYIEPPRSQRRWVIAATGRSGRRSLRRAGRAIGALISDPDRFNYTQEVSLLHVKRERSLQGSSR